MNKKIIEKRKNKSLNKNNLLLKKYIIKNTKKYGVIFFRNRIIRLL